MKKDPAKTDKPPAETSGKPTEAEKDKDSMTLFGLIYRILINRKLLIIALVIIAIAAIVYILYILPSQKPVPVPSICKSWTLTGRVITSKGELLPNNKYKVGIHTGPFNKDIFLVNGIFRITNVALPDDQFVELYLEYGNKTYTFYKQPLDPTKEKKDTINCVITFQEDIVVPDDILSAATVEKTLFRKQLTILVEGIDGNSFYEKIRSRGYSYSSSDPAFIIKFDHTRSIEKIGESSLYRYNGGYVRASINEKRSIVFDHLPIGRSAEIGNGYDQVEDYIHRQIVCQVRQHEDSIVEILAKLLR